MGREVTLFKSKDPKARSEVSAFLRDMADKMDAGSVTLRRGADEITLDIPGRVVLEIKVEDETKRRKGVQHSLEIELKWFDGDTDLGGVQLS